MSQGGIIRGYHCVYDIHYHIVFPVKYRKALINEDIKLYIKVLSDQIAERYGITFDAIGCDKDHIHVLCGTHPKYAPGAVVRLFKSITAKKVFERFPEVKKDLWGGEFWTDGYYIATVGTGGGWNVVERYVKNQGISENQLTLW